MKSTCENRNHYISTFQSDQYDVMDRIENKRSIFELKGKHEKIGLG